LKGCHSRGLCQKRGYTHLHPSGNGTEYLDEEGKSTDEFNRVRLVRLYNSVRDLFAYDLAKDKKSKMFPIVTASNRFGATGAADSARAVQYEEMNN
jgi:hypothetical protein